MIAGSRSRRCRTAAYRRLVGVELDVPRGLIPGGGEDELERLRPGVHQDQEVVIEQRRAVGVLVGVLGPVQVERDGRGARGRPVGGRHFRAGRG